jgi:hypothetical protein
MRQGVDESSGRCVVGGHWTATTVDDYKTTTRQLQDTQQVDKKTTRQPQYILIVDTRPHTHL